MPFFTMPPLIGTEWLDSAQRGNEYPAGAFCAAYWELAQSPLDSAPILLGLALSAVGVSRGSLSLSVQRGCGDCVWRAAAGCTSAGRGTRRGPTGCGWVTGARSSSATTSSQKVPPAQGRTAKLSGALRPHPALSSSKAATTTSRLTSQPQRLSPQGSGVHSSSAAAEEPALICSDGNTIRQRYSRHDLNSLPHHPR